MSILDCGFILGSSPSNKLMSILDAWGTFRGPMPALLCTCITLHMYCTAPLDGGVGNTLSYVILCTKISNIVRPISHTIFLCLLAIASTNTVKHKHVCVLHHDAFVSEKSPNLPFPSFVQNKRVFYFLAKVEQG